MSNVARPRGFTLIEVLIAMTILFGLVTTGLVAFQNAQNNSERAVRVIKLLNQVEYIKHSIKAELLQNPMATAGAGRLAGVAYQWQAETTALLAAPPTIDPDSGVDTVPEPRFRLANISLTLSLGSTERYFQYQELTWLAAQ